MNKCLKDAANKMFLWEDLEDRKGQQNMLRIDKVPGEVILPEGDTCKMQKGDKLDSAGQVRPEESKKKNLMN